MTPTFVGISGARRNACAALAVGGVVASVCEQERLTRARGAGLQPQRLPMEAVDQVLALAGRNRYEVSSYVTAESLARLPEGLPVVSFDHHQAHAATAFLTSPFQRAAVLVCDSDAERELSVWRAEGTSLKDVGWSWGKGFASLYSEAAELFGLGQHGDEHRLEALARLGGGQRADDLRGTIRYRDGGLHVEEGWRRQVQRMIQEDSQRDGLPTQAASAFQRRVGQLLLELVADVRSRLECETLCLGGGFFYNTYFTTLVHTSGLFRNVFVPINPGNAGLAVGAPLLIARGDVLAGSQPVAPFLGPGYDCHAIKDALDGCKLSYTFLSETDVIDATVKALARGQLVGWFQGRMEWGHRSLGHRSILADPQSPYVLDNLNFFLRKRERWRSFGVSVCEDRVSDLFVGPPASPYMEFEYRPRDPERLRHIIPPGATSIRVQTVSRDSGRFWELHRRMEQATGLGVLVNTSFNAFQEPIVCSPRDGVRVFYGTGLETLVLDRFLLRK